MLICSTCGGHFEARKNPWREKEAGGHPRHVYVCATRRRKPGVCGNTLALPIEETDDTVLSTIEGEVLGTRYIRELLALVDNAPDETVWLTADRDRVQTEVDRLVTSIAAGVPPATVAPLIQDKEAAIRKLEGRIRKPRLPRLEHHRLKAALEQRAAAWKAELRAEPKVARMLLRRLVGPITLWDASTPGAAWVEWRRRSRRRSCWTASSNLERPQRDSNPCFGLERATSWASGRWGQIGVLRCSGTALEQSMITGRHNIRQTTRRPGADSVGHERMGRKVAVQRSARRRKKAGG